MIPRSSLPCPTKLRLLLNYDPETGLLTWRRSARRGYKPGDVAGSIHRARNIYRVVRLENRGYYAHRLIWKIMTGEEPPSTLDHCDGDGLNNQWSNLRLATNSQNGQNRMIGKNNKSGIKGVHWDAHHKAWKASIKADGVLQVLGYFSTVEEASMAITDNRPKLHLEFARAG